MKSIFNAGQRKIILDWIGLIDGYDEKRVRETLNLLLRDRNEFNEIAKVTGIPKTSDD